MKIKRGFIRLAVFLVILTIFVGYRLFVYEQEAPLRHGLEAIKISDYKLALELLEPYATKKGELLARRSVGEIYAFGLGVPIDNKIAQQWFDCTGIDGCIDGEGEYGAGLSFDYGYEVLKSPEKARFWMLQSSHKGFQKADIWLKQREAQPQK